jgi:hypothetical protein
VVEDHTAEAKNRCVLHAIGVRPCHIVVDVSKQDEAWTTVGVRANVAASLALVGTIRELLFEV